VNSLENINWQTIAPDELADRVSFAYQKSDEFLVELDKMNIKLIRKSPPE
jgi:hypothetical protein